jgi:hypothetical protein
MVVYKRTCKTYKITYEPHNKVSSATSSVPFHSTFNYFTKPIRCTHNIVHIILPTIYDKIPYNHTITRIGLRLDFNKKHFIRHFFKTMKVFLTQNTWFYNTIHQFNKKYKYILYIYIYIYIRNN